MAGDDRGGSAFGDAYGQVWWLTRRDGWAPVPKEFAKVVQPGLGTTVLDLRPFRVSRSDQPKGELPVLNLKRARQRVVIETEIDLMALPPGKYTLALRRAGKAGACTRSILNNARR
jgi:hypothetical protein